jgi:hypothetical protein
MRTLKNKKSGANNNKIVPGDSDLEVESLNDDDNQSPPPNATPNTM